MFESRLQQLKVTRSIIIKSHKTRQMRRMSLQEQSEIAFATAENAQFIPFKKARVRERALMAPSRAVEEASSTSFVSTRKE